MGHVVARCLVEDRRKPRRRKVHVRSKIMGGKLTTAGLARAEIKHAEIQTSNQGV